MLFLLRVLALALAIALPAAAQDQVPFGTLTQSQQIAVIQRLVEAGQIEQAQFLLSGSRFDEGDAGFEAAYLQAVIFRIQGRFAEAEALLRQILDERPEFRLVRLELAQVLAAQGRRAGAGFQFELLADSAETLGEAEEFERIVDRINPDQGFQPSVFVTIAPSTNFNRGASSEFVTIGGLPFRITNTEQSGIGLRYGGALAYATNVSEAVSVFGALSLQRDDYPQRAFDVDTARVRAGLRVGPEARRFTFEGFADWREVAGAPFDTGQGLRASLEARVAPRLTLRGEATFEQRDFESDVQSDRRAVEIGATRSLGARAGLRGTLRAERQMSRTPNLDYSARAIELGGYLRFGPGVLLDGSIEREDRDYALVVLGERRFDDITRVRVALQWDRLRIGNGVPLLALVHTDNASSTVPFEFSATGVELTLSQAF